jgi:hypothetical protein
MNAVIYPSTLRAGAAEAATLARNLGGGLVWTTPVHDGPVPLGGFFETAGHASILSERVLHESWMDSKTLIALVGATLAGGAVGSLGLNILIRSKRGRSVIKRWSWWLLAVVYVLVLVLVAAGLTWTVRTILDTTANHAMLESPWFFLAFGFLVGLPFTLPTATLVWRTERGTTGGSRKTRPASRQERQHFARDLEGQIREFVGNARSVHLELQGDKGQVLVFGGDFTREEGERLVAALRADLQAVDFARVEGQGAKGKWWVRVAPTNNATSRGDKRS